MLRRRRQKHCNHHAQHYKQRQQQAPATTDRARCSANPVKKTGFVENQRNDNQGDERERHVLDDASDYPEINPVHHTRSQYYTCIAECDPTDARILRLPYDEYQHYDENWQHQHDENSRSYSDSVRD